MSKKLFLAPNHHLLNFALTNQGEEVSENTIKKGCLQAEYDWQDIDDDTDISTKDLLALLTSDSAGYTCAYVLKDELETHQLLMPPVSAWLVNYNDKQSGAVESAILQWLDYIEAAKQLLLLLPGQVVATWPVELQSAAAFEHQLQLILEQDQRVALATQEWCSFVVRSENTPSAIALASELIKQKQSQAASEKEHFKAKTALKQDISDLSNELAKVCAERNKLAELEPQLSAKQTELEQLQQSNSDLQEKLNQSEATHQQVSEALKTQEAQNNALAQDAEKLKESLAQQEEIKAVLEQTQTQLTNLQEEHETASQDKLSLVSRLEANNEQLKEKTNQLDKANAQISQLQTEIEKLTVSNHSADNELNQIKNKATELETQLNAAGNELAEHKNELELATLQVTQLQQELEQLIKNKKVLEETLQQSVEKEKTQAEQLNEKGMALTVAQQELQLVTLQLSQLQQELESVSAKEQTLQTALQSAKAEAEQAKSKGSQSDTKYNETCAELELATLQISELQQELESVSAKEKNLQTALQSAKAEAEVAKSKGSQADTKYNETCAELELATLQISELQQELESVSAKEQNLQTAIQSAKAEAVQAKSEASQSASKYKESSAELELATLQLGQLQEELEQLFAKEQAATQALSDAETAQATAKQNADEATAQLGVSQQEIELLTLQLNQLQEELEHYFVAYQKLKAESSAAASEAKGYWKNIIKARTNTFLVAQKVQVTGGFDNDNVQRIITRLNQVTNLKDEWDAFSVIFNDRNGNLDIEFHAPAENRFYPLSQFVKTGSSKVCDYSIIKPLDSANCKVLAALNDDDKALLIEIVREVSIHLHDSEVEVLQQAENINVQAWGPKLTQMLEALSTPKPAEPVIEEKIIEPSDITLEPEEPSQLNELAPITVEAETKEEQSPSEPAGIPQTADGLSFTKLTLSQNMVAETNQHLSIRADNLSYADRSFEQFEFKIGAKRIEKDGFTQFGSIELREQKGVAPISDWSIATEDKWGKKLILSLGPIITAAEKQNITSLNGQDQAFVRAFLSALIKHIHKLDLNRIELANPISDWHTMLSSMLEQFNHTAPVPAEIGE